MSYCISIKKEVIDGSFVADLQLCFPFVFICRLNVQGSDLDIYQDNVGRIIIDGVEDSELIQAAHKVRA